MLRVAIIASNFAPVRSDTVKGTEFLVHSLLTQLHADIQKNPTLSMTVFASGDSQVPFPLISVDVMATSKNAQFNSDDRKMRELALLSKAFSMQEQFDLYHVHIVNGEYVLPFARFVNKPIIFTMYSTIPNTYGKEYFNLFSDLPNTWFVSVPQNQRTALPELRFAGTIHHGIDLPKYSFNPTGGDAIIWTGRAMPEKGPQDVVKIAQQTKHPVQLFPLVTSDTENWYKSTLSPLIQQFISSTHIDVIETTNRYDLVSYYQKSKLFLFPLQREEPFGLVFPEAMACGTPVVAYARGSATELIQDGSTGFLINESPQDIRGDWIIKKTGIDGLIEAVQRIYAMPNDEYLNLRKSCRMYIEKGKFSLQDVSSQYLELYKKIASPIS